MNATTIQSAHDATTSPATAPTLPRQQRFDLYGPIHKSLRAELMSLLVRMGTVTFANSAVATRIVDELEELLVTCEKHIEHEIQFIHPQLAARLPAALANVDAGHDEHARFVTELRALMNGVTAATTPDLRDLAGRTLYLHFTAFVADTLAHMVEEERVLQPLMHRFFSDEELLAINGAIIQSLSPEETFRTLGAMIPAVNGPERAGIIAGVWASAPPEAFQSFVTMLRPRLDAEAWAELVALCPFVG